MRKFVRVQPKCVIAGAFTPTAGIGLHHLHSFSTASTSPAIVCSVASAAISLITAICLAAALASFVVIVIPRVIFVSVTGHVIVISLVIVQISPRIDVIALV